MGNERYLIINADDFGMCHSTNQAISTLFLEKAITSASLMVTTPWVLEASSILRQHPQMDVGVHITNTSEWEQYKWGGLTNSKTLVNDFGHFPADTQSIIAHADPEELQAEAIAQIELAYKLGVDPSNIDNHMKSMHHVTEILIDLCTRYHLPLRYPKRSHAFLPENHQKLVSLAEQKGVLMPDFIEMLPFTPPEGEEPRYEITKQAAISYIRNLKPGITELIFHPSLDTEELKAITDTWSMRRFEFDVFRDQEIQSLLHSEDVRLISWRDLRKMQRL